jgi:hypothetical protein
LEYRSKEEEDLKRIEKKVDRLLEIINSVDMKALAELVEWWRLTTKQQPASPKYSETMKVD